NEAQTTDHDGNGMELKIISIDSLIIPQHHPRSNYGNLETLQGSIKREGLQEPLLVYEIEAGKFGIIDGARRLKAVQEMGLKKISCLIKKGMDASDGAHLSYVKNTERNSLNPIEIALHLKAMIDEFGYTQSEMELKGYGSKAKISGQLKLLDLPESIQNQIQEGKLTTAHGCALIRLKTKKEQERMAKQINDFDLTAKRAEIRIDRYLTKGKKKNKKKKEPISSSDIPGVYIKDSRDMSELPDKSVHMVLSSPPYNVGMEFEKGVSFDEHVETVKDVLKECARVLVPGGIMALNIGDINNFKGRKGNNDYVQVQLMAHIFQSYLRKHKIFLTDVIIWKKSLAWLKRQHLAYSEKLVHTKYRIFDNFEPVYIFKKKGERELPSEEVILKSKLNKEEYISWIPGVWEIKSVQNMEEHPCIWPDELPRRLVKMFTYEGDNVLDPWLGSGTTIKMARELNREGIGYERESQYKAVIMKKLGVEPEVLAETATETMVDFAKSSLNNDESSDEAKVFKKPEPEVFGSPDMMDIFRDREETGKVDEIKELDTQEL
ncbi:MAG: ParB/RepB/Spo0J family partition protein, partial [Bacteroidales bacterium]|nr:ParB/RepB/Spo0J family partition protein [Bacteroidales bacterium]